MNDSVTPHHLPRALFICEQGLQTALADELRRTCPTWPPIEIGPGRVSAAFPADVSHAANAEPPVVAFSRQCLPLVELIAGDSISRQAEATGERLIGAIAADAPWRLHVFATPFPDGSTGFRRAQLVRQQVLEHVKRRKRRLLKQLRDADAPDWQADETLIQLVLTSRDSAYYSAYSPARLPAFRRLVSRFVGGDIEPAVDKRAPSRAFAKLVEVERRMNRPIAAGETCVDLGSAPGSWAYTALRRGARVTAVDRSPLRDDLMRDPRLTFVRGDAFKFRPERPVDWLLSDVIAYPDRIAKLLADWLGGRLCRFLCVTVKFRGRDDDAKLEDVKGVLRGSGYEFCLRRLNANKNEATAYGYWPTAATAWLPLA